MGEAKEKEMVMSCIRYWGRKIKRKLGKKKKKKWRNVNLWLTKLRLWTTVTLGVVGSPAHRESVKGCNFSLAWQRLRLDYDF